MFENDPRYLTRDEYDELRRKLYNHNSKRLFRYVELLHETLGVGSDVQFKSVAPQHPETGPGHASRSIYAKDHSGDTYASTGQPIVLSEAEAARFDALLNGRWLCDDRPQG